jgi:hypothetical protein
VGLDFPPPKPDWGYQDNSGGVARPPTPPDPQDFGGLELPGEDLRGSADDRADVGDHRQCEDQFGNLLRREPSFREAEMFTEQQAADVGFEDVREDGIQQGQQ